jgi:hypothetical protein
MRSLVIALSVVSVASSVTVGCAAPSIGSLDTGNDLPDRDGDEDADDDDDDDKKDDKRLPTKSPDTGSTTSPATGVKQTLTIAATGDGAGDVTSDPPGVACTDGACKGDFVAGTKVTLTPTPKAGSVFAGWSGAGGECPGTTCSTTVGAAATISAKFITLAGTWAGTYSHSQKGGNGCTFNNQGTLENTMAGTSSFTTAATATGFELRNGSCNLVQTSNGSAGPSAATVTGNKVTGKWNMNIQGAGNGALPLPFEATIVGNKMSGKWTCTGCTGTFDITKQ